MDYHKLAAFWNIHWEEYKNNLSKLEHSGHYIIIIVIITIIEKYSVGRPPHPPKEPKMTPLNSYVTASAVTKCCWNELTVFSACYYFGQRRTQSYGGPGRWAEGRVGGVRK